MKTLSALMILVAAIVASPAQADSYPFKTLGQIGREQDAERRYNQRQRDYEAALNFFKANKIKEAASAFETFGKNYPESTLAPNAQYWLGNAHYTLRDCRKAIDAHKVVVAKWPQHPKAPDSLIGIATCQQEIGDAKGAKTTFETVLAKYPGSPAATTAKQRLKK